jgi:tetratricopeptide (TPR) repeat protein
MKTINNILIFFILAIFLAFGCSEDFLVVENKNALLDVNYQNQDGLRKYETGMFNTYRSIYDYFWTCYISGLTNEYIFHHTGGEGQQIREWSDLNPKPTNEFAGFLYGRLYNAIRLANIIIEIGEAKMGDIAEMPVDEYNRIIGAAYYMRGLCHFQLMQVWGKTADPEDKWGIVIQTVPVTDRKQFQIPRSKPSEVYAQIYADLKKAKELLPLDNALPAEMLGHPTRGSATAFLGKAYLFRKDYASAKAEFEQFFLENPSKKLVDNYGDLFHAFVENGPESVFEIQYGDLINLPDTWGGGAGRPYQEFMGPAMLGRNNVLIPELIMSRFEKNDIRKIEAAFTAFADTLMNPDGTVYVHIDTINPTGKNEMRYKTTDPVVYGPKKYINKNRSNTNSGGNEKYACNENEIVMRVAEVYMMYAETLAETGDLNNAYEYMNKVRRRAFGYKPSLYTSSPYDFPVIDKQDFYTKLYDEFAREFISENLLWFNWIRWGIVVEEVAKTGREFLVGTHEAMPIPDGEIRTDQLVLQNPGY